MSVGEAEGLQVRLDEPVCRGVCEGAPDWLSALDFVAVGESAAEYVALGEGGVLALKEGLGEAVREAALALSAALLEAGLLPLALGLGLGVAEFEEVAAPLALRIVGVANELPVAEARAVGVPQAELLPPHPSWDALL